MMLRKVFTFLFLCAVLQGCTQSPGNEALELTLVPKTFSTDEFGCPGDWPVIPTQYFHWFEKQYFAKNLKLKFVEPIQADCRPQLDSSFFDPMLIPRYYLSGNTIRIYDFPLIKKDGLWDYDWDTIASVYAQDKEMVQYYSDEEADFADEFIEYISYDKPLKVDEWLSEMGFDSSAIAQGESVFLGSDIVVVYHFHEGIANRFILKEGYSYYYRYSGSIVALSDQYLAVHPFYEWEG